jgi:cyclopropane fatty-acyl-phospholipid synthase-like methyltransferase
MKGSTGGSRAALDSKEGRYRRRVRHKHWTPQRLRSQGSYWQCRLLSTAVHLEIFDWLGKETKGFRAATSHYGGTQEGWEIFLDALAAMGLLQKQRGRYENSPSTLRYLCAGKGSFLLPDHDAWDVWASLPKLLITGKRPSLSKPFFTDPRRTERLLKSLDTDARKIAPYLIERLPLSRSETLLDVGGGLGTFALACCRRFEHLQATVVEHPRVVSFLRSAVDRARMANRVQVVALDIMKDPLPAGFDLALVSNVLHGQEARENRALLKNVYGCLNQGGWMILRDVFMNHARTEPQWGALFSVSLLLHTPNGRCYPLDEVRDWLRKAGFSGIQGPFRSSPLSFDPDALLIAKKI